MRHPAIALLLASMIAALPIASPASADKPSGKKEWRADPARGERLAENLCAACHVIKPDQTTTAIAGVPTFPAIANLPGRTPQHLTNTLIQPHPPMPDAQLTGHEIADLLAYFDTLRKTGEQDKAAPTTPQPTTKPPYPSPS